MPYDRDVLHSFLDRDEQDVFALRHGENDIAVFPLFEFMSANQAAFPMAVMARVRGGVARGA